MAIVGRHHRVCVATSRRPHPDLLESGLPVRLPLPINPCVNASAHPYGVFGVSGVAWIGIYSLEGYSENRLPESQSPRCCSQIYKPNGNRPLVTGIYMASIQRKNSGQG